MGQTVGHGPIRAQSALGGRCWQVLGSSPHVGPRALIPRARPRRGRPTRRRSSWPYQPRPRDRILANVRVAGDAYIRQKPPAPAGRPRPVQRELAKGRFWGRVRASGPLNASRPRRPSADRRTPSARLLPVHRTPHRHGPRRSPELPDWPESGLRRRGSPPGQPG